MSSLHHTRPCGESGFALVVVIGVMAVVMLFSVGAFAAVNGDLPGSRGDVTRKQAFDAAEVGVADYLAMLNADSAAWTKCTGAGPALNNPWTGRKAPAGTRWRKVPGETSQYSIELLPARNSGFSACSTDAATVAKSMIDPISHGLRIRVTGQVTGEKGTVQRSVIATFKRASFLDYLYFTDYESSDPIWMVNTTRGHATKPTNPADGDVVTWAQNTCVRYYRPAAAGAGTAGYNRPGYSWNGRIDVNDDGAFSTSEQVTYNCDAQLKIQFASNDKLLGPMHTNDEFLMCDNFTAGRSDHPDDRIESGRAWRPCPGASGKPNFVGTFVPNAPTLKLPPTDATLASVALPAYTFSGQTRIVMNNTGTIDITNNGVKKTLAPPPNGVIYVKNGTSGSCGPYQPLNPYQQGSGTTPTYSNSAPWGISAACGDALVSGTYTKDLTIAAANDVIVTADVISSDGEAHLGLIADNFVRVQHLVSRTDSTKPPTSCTEPTDGSRIKNRRIDAAILSLLHSFMVDNYYCGGSTGTLTVNGVIAQKFRGAVATGTGSTGFLKDYHYEESLAYKGPPHFLDPVQAAWKLRGYTEQQGQHTPNP